MEIVTEGNREKKIGIDNDTYMLIETNFYTETRQMFLVYLRGSYSWINPDKGRGKKIYRMISLSNEKLENLREDNDELISKFASDIVGSTKNKEYYPSWYLKEYTIETYKHHISEAKENQKKEIKKIHKQKKVR